MVEGVGCLGNLPWAGHNSTCSAAIIWPMLSHVMWLALMCLATMAQASSSSIGVGSLTSQCGDRRGSWPKWSHPDAGSNDRIWRQFFGGVIPILDRFSAFSCMVLCAKVMAAFMIFLFS
jgi:hypothetical protein